MFKFSFKKTVIPIVLITLLSGCGTKNDKLADVGKFEFSVLKAGQADATVLKTENHCIIIDCGEKDDGGKIVKYLVDNNISKIDCIIITHFDKDHVGGFPEAVESIKPENVFVPNYEGSNNEYKKYLKCIEDNQINVTPLTKDISFSLDNVFFEVSPPQKSSYAEGDNDFSLAVSIAHGENTFLFAGDAESERLTEILKTFGRQYDFLKMPHHGRYNKTTDRFINTVKPTYTVITDSEKNPAEDKVLTALKNVACTVYSTKDGNVSVMSDGKEIKINQ